MNKTLYAIYDNVASTIIGGIIQDISDAPAIRAFSDALKNKDSILAQHPEDYELRSLGTINNEGEILPFDQPNTVITGKLWREMNNA